MSNSRIADEAVRLYKMHLSTRDKESKKRLLDKMEKLKKRMSEDDYSEFVVQKSKVMRASKLI